MNKAGVQLGVPHPGSRDPEPPHSSRNVGNSRVGLYLTGVSVGCCAYMAAQAVNYFNFLGEAYVPLRLSTLAIPAILVTWAVVKNLPLLLVSTIITALLILAVGRVITTSEDGILRTVLFLRRAEFNSCAASSFDQGSFYICMYKESRFRASATAIVFDKSDEVLAYANSKSVTSSQWSREPSKKWFQGVTSAQKTIAGDGIFSFAAAHALRLRPHVYLLQLYK